MAVKSPQGERQSAGTRVALGFGMTFASAVAVFTALGWWIDQRRGGGQAFTLAGIFLGLAFGGYELWKLVKMLNDESKKPKPDEPPDGSGR